MAVSLVGSLGKLVGKSQASETDDKPSMASRLMR